MVAHTLGGIGQSLDGGAARVVRGRGGGRVARLAAGENLAEGGRIHLLDLGHLWGRRRRLLEGLREGKGQGDGGRVGLLGALLALGGVVGVVILLLLVLIVVVPAVPVALACRCVVHLLALALGGVMTVAVILLLLFLVPVAAAVSYVLLAAVPPVAASSVASSVAASVTAVRRTVAMIVIVAVVGRVRSVLLGIGIGRVVGRLGWRVVGVVGRGRVAALAVIRVLRGVAPLRVVRVLRRVAALRVVRVHRGRRRVGAVVGVRAVVRMLFVVLVLVEPIQFLE